MNFAPGDVLDRGSATRKSATRGSVTVQVAKSLSFPAAELATEVIASLANRGGGKSNGAAVIVEGLLRAEIPVVVIDYVGIWPSLRLKADGKTPSEFAIPVLGGPHGDIPLSPSAGAVVAEALAEGHSSAVLDVSAFSKADRCRFATDFAEAFFRAKKKYPGPVQLVLEEAQRYVPQRIFHGMERMVGAFTEIAEVGRNYGIGLHLISQRPQKIDKDVLNLADTLFVYRTIGVLERKAISEWVQEKDAPGRANVHDELPGLARGQAVVWSPSRDVYGQFQIFKKRTYDAGATPLQARVAMKPRPIDLGVLKVAMEKVVEEVKSSDPVALRAEVARLRRELEAARQLAAKSPGSATLAETVKASGTVLLRGELESVMAMLGRIDVDLKTRCEDISDQAFFLSNVADRCKKIVDTADSMSAVMTVSVREGREAVREILKKIGKSPSKSSPGLIVEKATAGSLLNELATGRKLAPSGPLSTEFVKVSRCEQALVTTLARRKTASASQLAVLSGYSRKSSGFATAVRNLKDLGFMTGTGNRYEVTEEGRKYVGDVEPLPGGKGLLDYWKNRLGRCEATLLQWVYDEGPVARADLAERSGYSAKSSGFNGAISTLKELGLVRTHREFGEEIGSGSKLIISDDFKEVGGSVLPGTVVLGQEGSATQRVQHHVGR